MAIKHEAATDQTHERAVVARSDAARARHGAEIHDAPDARR